MSRPARVDEEGQVETGFEDEYTCGECVGWIYSEDMQEWMCRYAIHDARNDSTHPMCSFMKTQCKSEEALRAAREALENLSNDQCYGSGAQFTHHWQLRDFAQEAITKINSILGDSGKAKEPDQN